MKKLPLFLALGLLTFSCNKVKTGDVTFWESPTTGAGITVVTLKGVSSNITSDYATAPSCGASGCAVFNGIEEGIYTYTATDGTTNWSGTVDVTEGCTTVELY
jgi:hypothetical protein